MLHLLKELFGVKRKTALNGTVVAMLVPRKDRSGQRSANRFFRMPRKQRNGASSLTATVVSEWAKSLLQAGGGRAFELGPDKTLLRKRNSKKGRQGQGPGKAKEEL